MQEKLWWKLKTSPALSAARARFAIWRNLRNFYTIPCRILPVFSPLGHQRKCSSFFPPLVFYSGCEYGFSGIHIPMLSSSFWIRSLTMSSACCRMCMASSMVQFSRRTESMASSLSPGSRVPVLADRRAGGSQLLTGTRELLLLTHRQNPINLACQWDPWG